MTLKPSKPIRVDKLCTIKLLEADFNFNNKKLNRNMMHAGETLKLFVPEQFDDRKTTSTEKGLNKQVAYGIIHQTRTPTYVCSDDAKSCYDRIIHVFTSISLQRLVIPLESIKPMILTLQNLQHHIRIAYEEPNAFIGPKENLPIFQGSGQGNGDSGGARAC